MTPEPFEAAPPALIGLPAGEFVMGETGDDKFVTDVERPAHRVAISRPFARGRFPVTHGDFRAFAPGWAGPEDAARPVVRVSWDDAQIYCAWLRAETGRPYRLPTEAEWEYACRAGTRGPFSTGDEISPGQANYLYSEEGERVGAGAPTPAGRHPANAFGLEDMHGNVCEWVEDTWHPRYARAPAPAAGSVAGGDTRPRVNRPGARGHLPRLLRSAGRDGLAPAVRADNVGFRLALSLE